MAFYSQQTKPLSTFQILSKALQLYINNFKLLLPILLLSFLSSSLFFLFLSLSINPTIADLTSKSTAMASLDPNSPEYASLLSSILQDLRQLALKMFISVPISFLASSLIVIATIRTFSSVDQYFKGWHIKGPIITQLYVRIFTVTFSLLPVFGVILIAVAGGGGHTMMLVIVAAGVTLLVQLILLLRFATPWSVAVVVSVVEDGCYGLKAISKAEKLIGGRRMQGALLAIIESAIFGVIYWMYNNFKASAAASSSGAVLQIVVGIVIVAATAVFAMFSSAVCVVFYDDCRRSSGEGAYDSLACADAAHHDDKMLP